MQNSQNSQGASHAEIGVFAIDRNPNSIIGVFTIFTQILKELVKRAPVSSCNIPIVQNQVRQLVVARVVPFSRKIDCIAMLHADCSCSLISGVVRPASDIPETLFAIEYFGGVQRRQRSQLPMFGSVHDCSIIPDANKGKLHSNTARSIEGKVNTASTNTSKIL